VLNRCSIDYKRDSLLGCSTNGVLQDCLVKLGASVKGGQILGRLQDIDLQVEVELDKAQAESTIAIRMSEAKYAEALEKQRTIESLRARDVASSYERRLQSLETETARMELEGAKHQQHLAQLKQRQAEALVRMREFVSPYDGIVVEILKEPGEPVSIAEPVFRVVSLDLLRVTGHLDIADAWRVREEQAVTVRPEVSGADLPIERETFQGSVVFVDRQIDPETQTCRVVAEVKNRDGLLRSGLEGSMEISVTAPTPPDSKVAPEATSTPL
jgi:RND family efflux transporter MFP subunit